MKDGVSPEITYIVGRKKISGLDIPTRISAKTTRSDGDEANVRDREKQPAAEPLAIYEVDLYKHTVQFIRNEKPNAKKANAKSPVFKVNRQEPKILKMVGSKVIFDDVFVEDEYDFD